MLVLCVIRLSKKSLKHIDIKKPYSDEMKKAIIIKDTREFIEKEMPKNTSDVILSLTFVSESDYPDGQPRNRKRQ